MIRRFEDRRVVVTGAGSGIGRELVSILLDEGARVVGVDKDPAGVPAGAVTVVADLAAPDQVAGAMQEAMAALSAVDVLCNNAGVGSTKSVVDCSVEEWDHLFAVNARAVFLTTQAVIPQMVSRRSGVIVNTASAAGIVGLKDRAAYCASKGAVLALTRQVAVQYAEYGVRCLSVCPGTVDSPWLERLLAEAPDPEARRQELVARQPLGRLASPTEIARAIAYAASDDAAFMTGSELVIDGGILAG